MQERKSQLWSIEEDEKLKKIVAQGGSAGRASIALKRTEKSVREHARQLGCPFLTIAEARKKAAGVSPES
jgi:hypothetical protein